MWHSLASRKYLFLLASLLLLVIVRPLLAWHYLIALMLDAVYATLILLYLAFAGGKRALLVAALLLIPSVGFAGGYYLAWDQITPEKRVFWLGGSLLFGIAFLACITGLLLRDVVSKPTVTQDVIFGALSIYLLIGVLWSYLYAFVYVLDPTSFGSAQILITTPRTPADLESQSAGFLYYSFVTLSTLGYGDMWPTSRLTRTLSWVEAVTGQLYLAALVARLVALQTTRPDDRIPKNGAP